MAFARIPPLFCRQHGSHPRLANAESGHRLGNLRAHAFGDVSRLCRSGAVPAPGALHALRRPHCGYIQSQTGVHDGAGIQCRRGSRSGLERNVRGLHLCALCMPVRIWHGASVHHAFATGFLTGHRPAGDLQYGGVVELERIRDLLDGGTGDRWRADRSLSEPNAGLHDQRHRPVYVYRAARRHCLQESCRYPAAADSEFVLCRIPVCVESKGRAFRCLVAQPR